jgi:hypothetical protein
VPEEDSLLCKQQLMRHSARRDNQNRLRHLRHQDCNVPLSANPAPRQRHNQPPGRTTRPFVRVKPFSACSRWCSCKHLMVAEYGMMCLKPRPRSQRGALQMRARTVARWLAIASLLTRSNQHDRVAVGSIFDSEQLSIIIAECICQHMGWTMTMTSSVSCSRLELP